MKLSTSEAARFITRPDTGAAGVLIYGADAMRVAIKRQDLLANLLGPDAEGEMRLTRIMGASLRSDPAALLDAIKATGFFPGPRAVFVEDATDAAAAAITSAINEWAAGDAQIIVTAGQLTPRSALRKLFETQKSAFCIAVYDDPPSQAEVEAELKKAGLSAIAQDASRDLAALARALDPGDFRQLLEKLALYKLGDESPLSSAEVAALAPATIDAEIDEILHAAAEGAHARVGALMVRLGGQGVTAVALCIAALRHFRTLHMAACHPQGPTAGFSPKTGVFGPRRDRMVKQAQAWGVTRLEDAVQSLIETDLTLRSSSQAPQLAVMERSLIRLAMMPRNAR